MRKRLALLAATLMCVGIGFAASASSAAAATPGGSSARQAGAQASGARPAADFTCPASGYFCEYTDINFKNDVGYTKITQSFSGYGIDNKMSSFRNRSSCTVRLYDSYNETGSFIAAGANTEVSDIGVRYGQFWNDRISSILFVC